jgi:hypothetical protein
MEARGKVCKIWWHVIKVIGLTTQSPRSPILSPSTLLRINPVEGFATWGFRSFEKPKFVVFGLLPLGIGPITQVNDLVPADFAAAGREGLGWL